MKRNKVVLCIGVRRLMQQLAGRIINTYIQRLVSKRNQGQHIFFRCAKLDKAALIIIIAIGKTAARRIGKRCRLNRCV